MDKNLNENKTTKKLESTKKMHIKNNNFNLELSLNKILPKIESQISTNIYYSTPLSFIDYSSEKNDSKEISENIKKVNKTEILGKSEDEKEMENLFEIFGECSSQDDDEQEIKFLKKKRNHFDDFDDNDLSFLFEKNKFAQIKANK